MCTPVDVLPHAPRLAYQNVLAHHTRSRVDQPIIVELVVVARLQASSVTRVRLLDALENRVAIVAHGTASAAPLLILQV